MLSENIGSSFTFAMFLSGALLKAVPGIIVQIVLIPLLVMAYLLKNSSVIPPVATYAILIIATPVASIALYELLSRIPAGRTLVFGIRKRA